jgi:hypothetical protein
VSKPWALTFLADNFMVSSNVAPFTSTPNCTISPGVQGGFSFTKNNYFKNMKKYYYFLIILGKIKIVLISTVVKPGEMKRRTIGSPKVIYHDLAVDGCKGHV